MKKINKLDIHFEKGIKPVRRQLEALHDKINECVRAINLMPDYFDLLLPFAEKIKLLGIPSDFLKDTPIRLLIRNIVKEMGVPEAVSTKRKDTTGGHVMLYTLADCPAGLFYFNGILCFKSEYSKDGSPDAYVVSSDEYFWGGKDNRRERDGLIVSPFSSRGQKVIDSGYSTGEIWRAGKKHANCLGVKIKEEPRRELINTISSDPKVFHFSEINLAVLESGRYHVEKHRAVMEKIKVGSALVDAFYTFMRSLIFSKYNYAVSGDGTDWKIFGAKVKFAQDKDVYYMKPNEILFLSAYDRFYARGMKK